VDLSGRRQKSCPSETIWADFSSDCILGTLTNCFQPDDSIAASKVEEDVTEPVGSNTDERTPISPFSEPIVPEIQHSVCNRAAEEGDDCTCEPPAECSICLGDAAAQATGSPSCTASTSSTRCAWSGGCGPAATAPIAGPLWPSPNSRMQKLKEIDHESNGADYRTSPVPSKL